MTPRAPIHHNLLRLSAILLLATTAFPQTKEAQPKYDPATETQFKGIVEQLKLVPPTGAKPTAYLVMKATDAPQIYLCPKKFLDEMGIDFKTGDEIQITGSKIKQDGADLTLAREITKGDNTLILRFKDGKPAW